MSIGRNERRPINHLSISLDLTGQTLKAIGFRLDLDAADVAVDHGDIHARRPMGQPEFMNDHGVRTILRVREQPLQRRLPQIHVSQFRGHRRGLALRTTAAQSSRPPGPITISDEVPTGRRMRQQSTHTGLPHPAQPLRYECLSPIQATNAQIWVRLEVCDPSVTITDRDLVQGAGRAPQAGGRQPSRPGRRHGRSAAVAPLGRR